VSNKGKGRPNRGTTTPAAKPAIAPKKAPEPRSSKSAKGSAAARKSSNAATAKWWTSWRVTGLLVLGLFILYVASGNYVSADEQNDTLWTAIPAWFLAKGQTLNIESAPPLFGVPDWRFPVDGHLRSDRFPGAILTSVPFYWVLGKSSFTILPSIIMASATTAGAMGFMHRALTKVAAPATALGGALLLALGTGAWTVAADAPWTHGPVMLGLAIGTWAMTTQHYAGAGLGYAYAILARPHIAVVPFVVGVWESVSRRSIIPALKVGATSSIGIAAWLIYNRINAGAWIFFPGSYGERPPGAFRAVEIGDAPGWYDDIAGSFISLQRGWFVLSPFLLLLIPGIVNAWRVAPSWVRSSAAGGLVYLFVQLTANGYTGGQGFFGYRLTLEPLLLLVPLLAMSFDAWTSRVKWRLITFVVLATLAVGWHTLGAFFFDFDPTLTNPPAWGFEAVQAAQTGGPLAVLVSAAFAALVMGGLWYLWSMPGTRLLPDGIDSVDPKQRKGEVESATV